MSSHEDDSRRAAGVQVVDEMLGKELRNNLIAAADGEGVGADAARLVLEYCFGEIWSRPGLDRRSRSLVTLGILMAQGHQAEIRNHVHAGRANGLTADELMEAALHSTPYIGMPAAGQALRAVGAALAESRIE